MEAACLSGLLGPQGSPGGQQDLGWRDIWESRADFEIGGEWAGQAATGAFPEWLPAWAVGRGGSGPLCPPRGQEQEEQTMVAYVCGLELNHCKGFPIPYLCNQVFSQRGSKQGPALEDGDLELELETEWGGPVGSCVCGS